MHSLERREALEASAARRGVAFPDLADYDSWRNSADEAVSRGEDILANPEDYGLHLHSAARGGESLASALSRVREMLADDDRHLAETLVGRRQGESVWEREEHIARLLNDPDELRKLRHQRAERHRAGQRQRKAGDDNADPTAEAEPAAPAETPADPPLASSSGESIDSSAEADRLRTTSP